MEINNNDNSQAQEAYQVALEKVKKLRNFYMHVFAYVLVNAFVLYSRFSHLDAHESFWQFRNFSLLFYWGIGLVAHGFSVFVPIYVFGKNWEDRKVKQYMEEEKNKWE